MEDVSGLADSSKKIASFLTVARNLITIAFIFFTHYTQKKKFGNQLYHKYF